MMEDTTSNNTEEKRDEFHLDSDEKVEWYLSKVAELKNRKDRIKAQSVAMIAEVDTDIQSLENRFSDELRNYCLAQLDGKRKNKKFFNGTVSFRTVPGGLKIEDEDAFMECVKQDERLSGAILIKEVLDKRFAIDKAKTILEEYGEMLPGVALHQDRESMSISFGKTNDD